MKIKIMVCYHKPSIYITNDVYYPIQVGKSLSSMALPIQGDDTGNNISRLNGLYCELTGLYWAWKNIDADYIGLCHYRRFFTFENRIYRSICHYAYAKIRNIFNVFSPRPVSYSNINEVNVEDISTLIKKAHHASEDIKKYLARHPNIKIIALKPIDLGIVNNRTHFDAVAGSYHLDIITDIIAKKYPYLLSHFLKTLSSNKLHLANMSICSKEIFDEYCSFLFTVLKEHNHSLINGRWYANLSEKSLSRLSGYIAEILTSCYVSYIKAKYGKNAVKLLSLLKIHL